jgi:hypothetical protein
MTTLRNRTGYSKMGAAVLHRVADRSVRRDGVVVTANNSTATFLLSNE